ncbi:hypothetical protein BKA56DRAFT_244878 [Ilyonectria sp. MPI-CAGE-AT-0026]|nr:hypothetical protein BKA56DRAFT_244878 [Ilyonectria sp. MPI-CAGE-AT-0026]
MKHSVVLFGRRRRRCTVDLTVHAVGANPPGFFCGALDLRSNVYPPNLLFAIFPALSVFNNDHHRSQVFVRLRVQLRFVVSDVADIGSAGQGKHAESEAGQGLHVPEDVLLDVRGKALNLIANSIAGAGGDDMLDGTLSKDPLLLRLGLLECNRHLLHVRVERKLGDLVPLGLLSRGEAKTVPVKPRGKDLDGNLCRVAAAVPFAFDLVDGHHDVVKLKPHLELIVNHHHKML